MATAASAAATVALSARHVIELRPTAPLHFDASMHKPDHFPSADNAWQPGVRWQTMRWEGVPLGLKFENRGTVDRPCVGLSIWAEGELSPAFLASLKAEIVYRYNLDLDLGAFYARFAADPTLGPILEAWRGLRPLSPGSLYEYLIVAIVLQNAVVRRSIQMMQTLFEAYGTPLAFDGQTLYAFWPPARLEGVSEAALRALKVGYRAKSILRVTEAFLQGQIDERALRRAPRDEQRKALLDLYGIGPASVWYILFDVYHQWDELYHISPWERKIYSKLFFDRDPEDPVPVDEILQTLDARFGEWKMLAVHYIWEDLFWRREHEPVPWLEALIRR
jgi:3-methyladenine DNA glycosylase/8-oxoguanine DNA glycosylase